MKRLLPLLLLAAAPAQEQARIAAALAAEHPGARFGLVVADADGREIVALLPDQRFVPASNTKLLTTAALFASGIDLDIPDAEGGAAVRLEPRADRAADVVLVGHGDPRLSSAADCTHDCLATLADAVAARTRRVGDVVGDDSWFPDQRWSPGMSWNNMSSPSGTGISALTLDGNETAADSGYYRLDDRTRTGARNAVDYDRMPGGNLLRLSGTRDPASPTLPRVAVDDPAHYAAWRLAALLRARGVLVTGRVLARHRPPGPEDDPTTRGPAPVPRPPEPAPLARLAGPPLRDTAAVTNTVSQNVYAELLLRRVGRVQGTGSIADGQAAVARMLTAAGVPRTAYDLADGSGMSSYNRVSPRAMVTFLTWAARQPWGEGWRATLATPGQGTLRRRFRGTPLDGRLWAKTGTLNATNALAGYLQAKSGRRLAFAFYANDVPGDASATAAMDRVLLQIAEAN
jgi:serine-type D-Ala-D-Ala carboxypeptidase/endopeptidase (penicillin-binding protein 4)